MIRTIYHIPKMDCPSEEQLIRMKLAGIGDISLLSFDIPARKLTVVHGSDADTITRQLETLGLGAMPVNSERVIPSGEETHGGSGEKRLLWQVLGINAFFFILESLAGKLAGSMGLLADGLDMLADTVVYGLALLASDGAASRKKRIVTIAGALQLGLAVLGLSETIRRFIDPAGIPDHGVMIIISALALAGNALCLYLMQRSRSQEAHMKASMIFTSSDIIVNLGVIAAALLVRATGSGYPDLLIGMIVFVVVARGAMSIFKLRD